MVLGFAEGFEGETWKSCINLSEAAWHAEKVEVMIFGCRRCLGVRSSSWQEKLPGLSSSLNWTIVVDAGTCQFMTSDVTQYSVTLATILTYL